MDPGYPKERLAFMMEDAHAAVLMTRHDMAERLPEHGLRAVYLDSEWEAIAAMSETNPVAGTTAKNLAYILYTSGSTGQPKGVMCEHCGLVNYLCWVSEGPLGDPELCLPLTTKLTFDMCLKQLFPPLLRGGAVWILPEEILAEPAALLSALSTRPKVGMNCVPSLWTAILHAIQSGQATSPGESVAYLIFGGEPLSRELVARTLSVLPHLQIWNIYGPTEATANASAVRILPGDEVTIGRPIANTQIYILKILQRHPKIHHGLCEDYLRSNHF